MLRQFLGLSQGQQLEHLIERPKPPGKTTRAFAR